MNVSTLYSSSADVPVAHFVTTQLHFPNLILSPMYVYHCSVASVSSCDVMIFLVMGLLTLPYAEYHDLRVKAFIFIQTNYPHALAKIKASWASFKSFGMYIIIIIHNTLLSY